MKKWISMALSAVMMFSPLSADEHRNSFTDNLNVFAGIDGSKQPQDLGINANFGGRVSFNLGLPLISDYGLGIQIGSGYNYSEAAVKVIEAIEGSDTRRQWFTTLGLFHKGESGWDWGIGYDLVLADYFQSVTLGQVRGQISKHLSDKNELGIWFTLGTQDDESSFLNTPIKFEAIDQYNLYFRHQWMSYATTSFWLGIADGHSELVFVLPGQSEFDTVGVFGADIHVPLNDRFALYGEANFVLPADSGTVDSYLGFKYYLGGNAPYQKEKRYAPLMSVANNTRFALNGSR